MQLMLAYLLNDIRIQSNIPLGTIQNGWLLKLSTDLKISLSKHILKKCK